MYAERVLSGMRPTGSLHLGHYHGVLKNWVRLQNEYPCLFFVADWHALTTQYDDPQGIVGSSWDMVIDWLAAGVDPERAVLFKHVLRNALIPILTGVVVILPTLFIGNLIIEAFFGIPGLGSYTIEAIQSQDFAIVRAMVFLGSLLYIVGLILTDISYTLADPRVRLE